jgi:hypothetical protein
MPQQLRSKWAQLFANTRQNGQPAWLFTLGGMVPLWQLNLLQSFKAMVAALQKLFGVHVRGTVHYDVCRCGFPYRCGLYSCCTHCCFGCMALVLGWALGGKVGGELLLQMVSFR